MGAVGFLAATPFAISAYLGTTPAFPGMDAAKSFLAMMTDRSPGERTSAELATKRKKAAALPHQRALGKVTPPAPPEEFLQAIAPPSPVLVDIPPFPTLVAGLTPLLTTPVPPGGGGISALQVPPGGGGGGDDTETPTPTPQIQTPTAVPEPGTWATMLFGFGLTGWIMRRRRRGAPLARA